VEFHSAHAAIPHRLDRIKVEERRMTTAREDAGPLLRIFHPSDFTEASEVAFTHALKLALESRADF